MQSNEVSFVKLGDKYPDKKFILIQRNSRAGIFSHVITAFNWIKFALDNDYIPVVDIKSSLYFKDTDENIWEYAFKQPTSYTLNDALNAQNVFIASNSIGRPNYFYSNQSKFEVDSAIAKNNIVINNVIQAKVDQFFSKHENENIVGVLIRGTDYRYLKPKNHYVQPSIEQICNEIREYISKYSCQKIFLVSEDERLANQVKEAFADKVIDQNIYIDYKNNKTIQDSITKIDYSTFKQINIQYIANVIILSRLKYLISGITSATIFLNLVKEAEKYTFFNMGRYM